MIGRLVRVPLREVWRHEAADFTTWLQDNSDVLNEVLDINISGVERERAAGAFSVDLVAEADTGGAVVIENQLERSDHDHLGKLVTYLTMLEAETAIWIVSDPRPEHVRAVSWLNESSSAAFYLLKVEAVRIGDSPPAPLLTVIVGPSEMGREAGQTKKEFAERHMIRYRFWEQLLALSRTRTRLFENISPGHDTWVSTGAGRSGFSVTYVVRQHDADVHLYVDRGKDADEENKALFDALHARREEIEAAFGAPLEWNRLETKRACTIRYRIEIGGYRDEDCWPRLQEAMVDAMVQLAAALQPEIARLEV